jgi:geranylgeranyl pyrophosphate synthase
MSTPAAPDLARTFLAEVIPLVDATLESVLPPVDGPHARLAEAMRYSVMAGGKRLRPALAIALSRAVGGRDATVLPFAAALELVHTYSLIHDDLPAMDDDVLRRGRPTVHIAFDDATAILVGDALLTEGLLLLARFPAGESWAALRSDAVALVAEAVSSRGMVGGQADDIEHTGRSGHDRQGLGQRLEKIHRHKTGCLLQASVELGALLARADASAQRDFALFGRDLGLAFQVADDVLDATASAEVLGKSPGKDAASDKLTYVTLFGLEAARRRLDALEEQLADRARQIEGPDGELAALARFVCRRRS